LKINLPKINVTIILHARGERNGRKYRAGLWRGGRLVRPVDLKQYFDNTGGGRARDELKLVPGRGAWGSTVAIYFGAGIIALGFG
jgi:hypothetical protein